MAVGASCTACIGETTRLLFLSVGGGLKKKSVPPNRKSDDASLFALIIRAINSRKTPRRLRLQPGHRIVHRQHTLSSSARSRAESHLPWRHGVFLDSGLLLPNLAGHRRHRVVSISDPCAPRGRGSLNCLPTGCARLCVKQSWTDSPKHPDLYCAECPFHQGGGNFACYREKQGSRPRQAHFCAYRKTDADQSLCCQYGVIFFVWLSNWEPYRLAPVSARKARSPSPMELYTGRL